LKKLKKAREKEEKEKEKAKVTTDFGTIGVHQVPYIPNLSFSYEYLIHCSLVFNIVTVVKL
jgi:hypothetical protein